MKKYIAKINVEYEVGFEANEQISIGELEDKALDYFQKYTDIGLEDKFYHDTVVERVLSL